MAFNHYESALSQGEDSLIHALREGLHHVNSIRDRNGCSLLHLCVLYDKLELLATLINEFGCSTDLETEDGMTPLWWAANLQRKDAYIYLIEKGANEEKIAKPHFGMNGNYEGEISCIQIASTHWGREWCEHLREILILRKELNDSLSLLLSVTHLANRGDNEDEKAVEDDKNEETKDNLVGVSDILNVDQVFGNHVFSYLYSGISNPNTNKE